MFYETLLQCHFHFHHWLSSSSRFLFPRYLTKWILWLLLQNNVSRNCKFIKWCASVLLMNSTWASVVIHSCHPYHYHCCHVHGLKQNYHSDGLVHGLWYPQCISNGDPIVLHWAINISVCQCFWDTVVREKALSLFVFYVNPLMW